MREPYERIAGGPFRDDTHRAAVEATAVDLASPPHPTDRELVAALGRTGRNRRRMATDGVFGADGRDTRVDAEDGRVRASQTIDWQSRAKSDNALLEQLLKAQSDRIEADRLWEGDGVSFDRTAEAHIRLDHLTGKVLDAMREGWPGWRTRLVPADAAMRDVKPTTTQQGEP